MNADNQQERLLNPWYVTGWFDGEGCFSVSIHPHPSSRFGWIIDPVVQTYQHKRSIDVLKALQQFFCCGAIRPKGPNSNVLTFSIESRKSIKKYVIPHFLMYSLQTKKSVDFEIFCQVINLMENKEHFKIDGFKSIVNLAFQMNPEGKNRKYLLSDVLSNLKESSETIRQTQI